MCECLKEETIIEKNSVGKVLDVKKNGSCESKKTQIRYIKAM